MTSPCNWWHWCSWGRSPAQVEGCQNSRKDGQLSPALTSSNSWTQLSFELPGKWTWTFFYHILSLCSFKIWTHPLYIVGHMTYMVGHMTVALTTIPVWWGPELLSAIGKCWRTQAQHLALDHPWDSQDWCMLQKQEGTEVHYCVTVKH